MARSVLARNAVYNCVTPYYGNYTEANGVFYAADNETLGSSPFTAPGSGDFTPLDVGNVKGLGDGASGGFPDFNLWLPSYPSYPWKGAVQKPSTTTTQLLGIAAV